MKTYLDAHVHLDAEVPGVESLRPDEPNHPRQTNAVDRRPPPRRASVPEAHARRRETRAGVARRGMYECYY